MSRKLILNITGSRHLADEDAAKQVRRLNQAQEQNTSVELINELKEAGCSSVTHFNPKQHGFENRSCSINVHDLSSKKNGLADFNRFSKFHLPSLV